MVSQCNQTVPQRCCSRSDPLICSGLHFKKQPGFFFIIEWGQYIPKGKRIVCDFKSIRSVRLQLSDRIIQARCFRNPQTGFSHSAFNAAAVSASMPSFRQRAGYQRVELSLCALARSVGACRGKMRFLRAAGLGKTIVIFGEE